MKLPILLLIVFFLNDVSSIFIKNNRKKSSRYSKYSSESDEYYSGNHHKHSYDNNNNKPPPVSYSCDDGWTTFQRQSGPRCLKVFSSGAISQSAAEGLCVQQGGTLSGLESRAEGLWMNAQALLFRPATNNINDVKDIWIGGHRKPECLRPPYAASCYPAAYNMLYWTDPSVTGTAAFAGPWWALNPDNIGFVQNCLWLTVQQEGLPTNHYQTSPGGLADVGCNGEGNAIIGYACSKPQTKKN